MLHHILTHGKIAAVKTKFCVSQKFVPNSGKEEDVSDIAAGAVPGTDAFSGMTRGRSIAEEMGKICVYTGELLRK